MIKRILLSLLLLATTVNAGLPPTTAKGQNETLAPTTFYFQTPNNQFTTTASGTRIVETGNGNILLNPNFEAASAATSWTTTTASSAQETTIVRVGKKSLAMTFAASTGNVAQSVTPTYDIGASGLEASCQIKTAVSTIQVCSLIAGSESQCTSVPGDSQWHYVSSTAVGVTSSSAGVEVKTTATATGVVYIDDCYVGINRNLGLGDIVTDWQSYSLTIGGSTSAPTKGTIVKDEARWRRVGDSMQISYNYEQSAAGANGSGAYLFQLPAGYVIDTTKESVSTNAFSTSIVGSGAAGSGASASNALGVVKVYNTTALTLMVDNNTIKENVTDAYYQLGSAGTRTYSFLAQVPIVGFSASTIVAGATGNYDWVAYTPTFTGFGTATNIECQQARDSSDLLLRCKFTAGTATAVEARVSLPTGLTAASTAKIPSLSYAGGMVSTGNLAGSYNVLMEPAVAYVTFGVEATGSAGLSKATGSTIGSTNTYSFNARVPIQGWTSNNNAPLTLNNFITPAVRTVTATTTLSVIDSLILCDATAGTVTINLPSIATAPYQIYTVKKTDASANSCTIDPAGSETIDTAATKTNTTQNVANTFTNAGSGTNWSLY